MAAPKATAASGADLEALADDALVAEAVAGRREAFDVIVERHRRAVYQVCYRFVNNHEDARDLAQDTFVRAWRGLRSFRGQAALATWLYRIAVNVCLNRVTAKGPAIEPLDRVERLADDHAEDARGALLRAERAEAVRRAIAALPRKQRATVILRVYHGLSHQQIATILGSSVGAAKANLFHALASLKRILEDTPWRT